MQKIDEHDDEHKDEHDDMDDMSEGDGMLSDSTITDDKDFFNSSK